ncbi:uncharacterized protein DFE_0307 [Desulfovibrio ferrophilus]|uniref:Uncharacterized protein n=1 Tax=Desulfovibrio ferrophilus TaxID=241368 RepID=A0A2Z6AUX8_9BACT|nr:uncharacterized protein DFE_0307 [Desulfovibrio ferrophilus]
MAPVKWDVFFTKVGAYFFTFFVCNESFLGLFFGHSYQAGGGNAQTSDNCGDGMYTVRDVRDCERQGW